MNLESSATPSSASLKHLTYIELDILHSLRGFCAFYVVIFHAKYILWSGGRQYLDAHPRSSWEVIDYCAFAFDMISSAGYEMVIFFFVLSGFFIRYAQLRKHRKPVDFYINRIVRIYPPYLFSVLLAACSIWFIAKGIPEALNENGRELNTALVQSWSDLRELNILSVLRTLGFLRLEHTYIGYNDVYWSLLPEALFYLAVPLAFWRIKLYYVLSVLLHCVGLFWTRHSLLDPITTYLIAYNFYFAVGVLLYDTIIHTSWISRFKKISVWILLFGMILLFGILLVLAVLKLKSISGLIAVLLAVLSISTLLAGKVSSENLAVKILHKLGVFSFSLYLYHFPLLFLCYAGLVYLTGETIFYIRYYWLALPIVTGVSYLLYRLVERKFVNYFRKV